MNNKRIGAAAVLLLIIVLPVFLYFYFSPKLYNPTSNIKSNGKLYEYETFIESLDTLTGDQLLFVIDQEKDSRYIEDALLRPLMSENENVSLEVIVVDTSNDKQLTVTQLKNKLSIEKTPAFIYMNIDEDQNIEIKDTLIYYEDEPFTKETLKSWLYANDLWVGPYGE